ncbi:MAG: hypothetical protein FWF98_03140, partial [Dehalococcoidia bacterium]|nr:hypothetical protein [Dehalococcoidia bacterium]
TDKNCITFNPAPTNFGAYGLSGKLNNYRLSLLAGRRTMTHHIVQGEYLSAIFGKPVVGRVNPIETQFYFTLQVPTITTVRVGFINLPMVTFTTIKIVNPFANHDMDAFKNAWRL